MIHERASSAQVLVQKDFWGDYCLSALELLDKLHSSDTAMQRFLFSKTIKNSRYPSRHLQALSPPEQWHVLPQDCQWA